MPAKPKDITRESGLLSQLKKYGIKRLILSWDCGVALFAFVLIFASNKLQWNIVNNLDTNNLTFIVAVASAIFTVLLTALAIILSFSSSNFVKFLREQDMFDEIIFIFWWTSIGFLSVILLCFLKYLLHLDLPDWTHGIGSALTMSLFLYALIETYYVVGALMRFAYFLGHYEEIEPKNNE